jgi:hypothetical protein
MTDGPGGSTNTVTYGMNSSTRRAKFGFPVVRLGKSIEISGGKGERPFIPRKEIGLSRFAGALY